MPDNTKTSKTENESAFPIPGKELAVIGKGLTKGEYAAISAMNALVAAGSTDPEEIAEQAWLIAQALLRDI